MSGGTQTAALESWDKIGCVFQFNKFNESWECISAIDKKVSNKGPESFKYFCVATTTCNNHKEYEKFPNYKYVVTLSQFAYIWGFVAYSLIQSCLT